MTRDKELALSLLQVVESSADADGIDLAHLRSEHVGRHGEWTAEDSYHLDLLVRGSFLTKHASSGIDAASVQLTWAGHDLIEALKK